MMIRKFDKIQGLVKKRDQTQVERDINATVIKLGLDVHTLETRSVVYVLYMCGDGGLLVSHTSISKAVLRFWLPFGFRGFVTLLLTFKLEFGFENLSILHIAMPPPRIPSDQVNICTYSFHHSCKCMWIYSIIATAVQSTLMMIL